MYQLKKLKSLLLLLFVAVTAKAQIENGKVYNIVSVEYSKSLAITSGEYITIVPTNESGSEQLWYAEGDNANGYTLRSLCSGYYLRSSNGQSSKWTMVSTPDANCKLNCYTAGSGYTFRATNTTNDWHSMHLATSQGSHIVGWTSSASATQWTINEVSVTAAELETLLAKANEITGAVNNVDTYQNALAELFSDKACTTLNSTYASMDETTLKSQAAYKNLPTTLQSMVLKVRNNSWAENNYDNSKLAWDADYAKKYRVQLYEPYNEPESAASALGMNAHTNLNNPTGIFANVQDVLYVMVDGEIEDGSALYLASYKGHGKLGGYKEGIQLQQGLNIIPSFEVGNNYCINYVVHTFDTSKGKGNKAKARKLSDYEDLKIHIEGGYINGYWNKMGDYRKTGGDVLYTPDKNADWDYIAARATQTDVTVLGEYVTLQFPLNTALNEAGGEEHGLSYYYTGKNIIEASIDEWDKVMMWERLVMGLLDKETTEAEAKKSPYSGKDFVFDYIGDDTDGFESGYGDYYNVHGLSFGTPHGYMYGGWDHCGYHFNTMGAIMISMITDAGSHWGPAHEIGHQHQRLLTVNGLTEVTNNLFSNVVLWYFGKTTSRVNGSALEPIAEMFANEEADFFNTTSNVFITTQMYYKLFLYYHVLGHNPKFYPKLFEMLRQDPMSGGYYQNGSTSILHFYKKCCEAAGEDLTEFFRAYGFFRVMTDRLVGDYANSEYTQTQSDIDEAIAEVKAMAEENGWKQNIAVLFINDDTGEQILSHRDDVEYLTPYESADSELGCYASYVNTTEPNYTYTISGNTVTMTGEGGTGIAIFNEKGELVGFSDNKTFEVSDECAIAIASGQAEVVAMKADNTTVEAVDIMDTDDNEAKYALLGELLDDAEAIVELSDEYNSKLGYYRKEALTDLQTAYTNAKTVYDAKTVASYDAVYDALNEAYSEVLHNDYARIGLVEGNSYRLTNKAYPTRLMTVNTNNNQMFGLEESTDNPDSQLWYLESSDTEGRYYLKNKATSKYPGNVSIGAVLSANQEKDAAHAYELRDMGQGVWALVGNYGLHCSASQSYNIVGWGTDASATQWYITAVDVNANAEALYNLQALIDKTEALIDEVGYATQVQLQATDSLAPFHLYCNALFKALNNDDTSPNTAKLLDGDPATHIHTDYRTNEGDYKADDDLDHYLRVDLGSGNAVSEFKFTYTTRNAGGTQSHPKTIKIEGSNNLMTFEEITTLPRTGEGALPGANTNNDGRGVYTSSEITSSEPYRYLRFMVTETQGNNVKSYGDHPYFYMAEFDLELDNIVRVDDKYSSEITVDELTDVFNSLLSAKEIVENTNSEQYAAACSALEGYYNTLLADKNRVETSNLTALKEELAALIGETTDLIGECGTVKVVQGGALTLSVTPGDDVNYLTAGPNSNPSEGALSNLIDNDSGTSFTSNWGSQTGNPYLQVQLPNGQELGKFIFTFTARQGGGAPTPSTIVVSGSNDGQDFTTIETFTKEIHGFPAAASGGKWTSPEITDATAYKYLRFTVTKSERTNSGAEAPNGYYHFGISHFGVSTVGGTEVTLLPTAGGATKEDVLAAYNQNAEAQAVYDYATSELQVKAAIEKLVAAKSALEVAKGDALEYTVTVVGGNSQGGVVYGGTNRVGGVKFSAPTDLSVNDLEPIPLDGYVANGVALNGTTITVTYNKEYTVQVVGVDASAGGVKLGETIYNGGATFNMLESEFNIENFNAVSVEGYEADKTFEGSTITVTYKKIYTVQVVGVVGQGGVVFDNNNYTHNQELYALDLVIGNLAAMGVTGYVANVSLEGATITVTYNKIYTVQVVGLDGQGGVQFGDGSYNHGQELALSAIEVSQLTAVEVSGYVGTVTLNDRTIRVAYCKLIQDLSELRNYKAYHIRARSGEGYFAWNSSITDTYVSLRGMTNWSYNKLPSNETVANKYKEAVSLSDETVAWQIIKEDDKYYLYQPAKKEYVTRLNDRDYVFTAEKTALDAIRDNGDSTFGFHAGGGYSDASQKFACIVTNENEIAVRNWTWSDHGSVLQIIENPYVYALDYAVTVIGNANGGVEFEEESYTHGMTLSATELLTASDLTVKSIDGYEHEIEVNKVNATITITYTAIDKTELINLITNTEDLVNSASSHLGSSLNVTQALIDATNERLTTARSVRDDSSVNREEYDAILAELQAAYARLNTAIAYATLPVQLTFDVNSPVTYKITICRDNNPVLAYDNNSSMVAVTAFEYGNKAHGWYFVATTDGKVRIMPYYEQNTTLALSTNSFSEGNSKVKGMAIDSEGYTQEWTITNANMNEDNRNAGWYNITTLNPDNVNTTWYFSNHGGAGNKMGFYNYPNDGGSRFQFEQADFSKSDAYYTLYNYYHGDAKVKSSDFEGNDEMVGYYPIAETEVYKTAYSNAASVLESLTSTDEEYTNAYNVLKAANEALVINMPEEGKFYRLKSVSRGTAEYAYVKPEENRIFHTSARGIDDATTIWSFTEMSNGAYKMTNLHTGTSLANNGWEYYTALSLYDEAEGVDIVSLSLDGQVGFKCDGIMLHADGNGKVVHWNTGANDGSAWRIVEVEDMSLVKFAVSISQFEHAGLYLNYPVTIPDGVKAYYLDGKKITINNGVGSLNLTKIEDDVIPAETAVILYAPQGNYEFVYAAEPNYKYEDNLFTGSSYQTYREAEVNHYYYVFGQNNGEIGLYKNGVKYDATGAEGTTHYKMSANKILFDWDGSVSNVSSFRFRLGTGGQTTSLENALMMDNAIIYDLYGRRILEVKTSGLYIVNGEKRYIQVK